MCLSKDKGEWIAAYTGDKQTDAVEQTDEELYDNLAKNIVREITTNGKGREEEITPSCASKDIVKNVLRISTRKLKRSYSKEVRQMSDMVCERGAGRSLELS